jgi:hypothetical protein
MKHRLLAALVAMPLLGVCLAASAQGTRSMTPPIVVEVVDGRLVVSDPGYQLSASQTVATWQIITPGWRFASGSIRFSDAAAPFSCGPYAEGEAMRCATSGDGRGRYSYSIALRDDSGRLVSLPQPTIWIQND